MSRLLPIIYPPNTLPFPLRLRSVRECDKTALLVVVNKAYEIEKGTTGVSFKKMDAARYTPEELDHDFLQGLYVVAELMDGSESNIVGAILLEIQQENSEKICFFGPFATKAPYQKFGIGKILLDFAEKYAISQQCSQLQCAIINVRSDLHGYYFKRGFVNFGTKPYERSHLLSRPVHFILLKKSLTDLKCKL